LLLYARRWAEYRLLLGWNFIRDFFLLCNHANIMPNVRTLKDMKDIEGVPEGSGPSGRGCRLDSAYEQELKKKLRTTIDFNSEITDFNKKLQAENSE
jgi:hypothetical protein